MHGLRAAQMLEHVVITGGWDIRSSRNEVSVNFIKQVSSLHVQVLQYKAGAWSEIGRMKKARNHHAVIFCTKGGRLGPPVRDVTGFLWFSKFQVDFHGSRLVFHGSGSVFVVFHGFRMVFHCFRLASWFFMVPGRFSWFQVRFHGFSRFQQEHPKTVFWSDDSV